MKESMHISWVALIGIVAPVAASCEIQCTGQVLNRTCARPPSSSSSPEPAAIPFHRKVRYRVSFGAFIYYSGSVLIFSDLSDTISNEIWRIHNTKAVIGNMLYIGAFLC